MRSQLDQRDKIVTELRDLLANLDDIGLSFVAIKISEAIELMEQAELAHDPELETQSKDQIRIVADNCDETIGTKKDTR